MADRSHIPMAVVDRVWAAARERCGYCQAVQENVFVTFEIEHILPLSRGGTDDEANLWLVCPICNGHKSDKVAGVDPESGASVRLFNPRTERWADHFMWSADGLHVIGLTPVGRATVNALHLDRDPLAIRVRRMWVKFNIHPPKDDLPAG